jgi:hypothetical protein
MSDSCGPLPAQGPAWLAWPHGQNSPRPACASSVAWVQPRCGHRAPGHPRLRDRRELASGRDATRSAPREPTSCGAVAGQREKAADRTEEPIGGEAVESGMAAALRSGGGASGGRR